jgi:hypothetical protein
LHDATLGLLDRIGRADVGARRVLAVHAHHRRGLGGDGPVDAFEVDEDWPRWVPHSSHAWTHASQPMHRLGSMTKIGGRRCRSGPASCRLCEVEVADVGGRRVAVGLDDRTAATLNSGIFEIGSTARLVSWLAALPPGQWYGMNTVSGRIVLTTSPAG